MIAAAPPLPRSRLVVTFGVLAAALAIGPLALRLGALDATAWVVLGAIAATIVVARVGLLRLDLLLLAVNLAAIALLPAIHHRDPLAPESPHPFYDWTFLRATAPELLLLATFVAQWVRRQSVTAARLRIGAVPLLAIGFLGLGLLIGLLQGTSLEACVRDGRKIAYVAIAHWLVVRVADDPARRRTLARCLLAAIALRALATIASFLADQGFHYRGFLRATVDVGDFLGFLALIYLPAAQLRVRAMGARERLLLWLLIVVGSAATLATFSRAAWCAAPIGVAVLFLVRVRCARPAPRFLVGIALVGACATPLLFGGVAEQALARVVPLLQPSQDSSVSYRLRELRGAAAVAADHPMTGVGLGTRFDAGAPLLDRRRGAETLVHNLFVWSAVKAGVPGLLLVLALLALPALQLLRTAGSRVEPRAAGVALGLLALLAAFAVMSMVGAMLNQARVALALGVVTGLAQLLAAANARSAATAAPAEPRPSGARP